MTGPVVSMRRINIARLESRWRRAVLLGIRWFIHNDLATADYLRAHETAADERAHFSHVTRFEVRR